MQGVKPIAVTSTPAKLDNSKSLGAIAGINYKENPDFSKLVKEITNGQGADIILDCIGAQNFQYNLKAAAMDCQWIFFGAIGGVRLQKLNLGLLLGKRIHHLSTTLKNRSDEYKTELIHKFLEN